MLNSIEGMVGRCTNDGQPRLFVVMRVCAGACSQTLCVTTDFLVIGWHMAFMRLPDKQGFKVHTLCIQF